MATKKESAAPKLTAITELALGDKVEYFWVNRFELFTVREITTKVVANSVEQHLMEPKIVTSLTLFSEKLQRRVEAVSQSDITALKLRWPLADNERITAALDQIKDLEGRVADIQIALRKIKGVLV